MRSLITLALTLALMPLHNAIAETRVGMIKLASGDPTLIRAGTEMVAEAGMLVISGDVFVTDQDATVGILFEDDTRMGIGPNSNFSVDNYMYDRAKRSGQADMKVNQGTMALVAGNMIERDMSALKVRTPTAVIAVRGTEYAVEVKAAATQGE